MEVPRVQIQNFPPECRTNLWVSQPVSESLVPEDVVVVLPPAGRVHHVTARRRVRGLGQVRPEIEVVSGLTTH